MNRRPEYDVRKTGENLKRLRQKSGYSAEEVREYIGMGTVQAVYKWERGECFPTLDNFLALAELYNENPTEIIVRCSEKKEGLMEVEDSGKKARMHAMELYCFIYQAVGAADLYHKNPAGNINI